MEAEVVTTEEWQDLEMALTACTILVGAGNPGGMKSKRDKASGRGAINAPA